MLSPFNSLEYRLLAPFIKYDCVSGSHTLYFVGSMYLLQANMTIAFALFFITGYILLNLDKFINMP
jgi:hypothetical protein